MAQRIKKETEKKSSIPPQPTRPNKEDRLFQNLLRVIEQFMSGKGFVPLTESELMERLSLPLQHAPLLREILQSLVRKGVIDITRGRYTWKGSQRDIVKGTIRMHPRGFGFLQADDPVRFPQDIFIPKQMTKNAVDGDQVEVQVAAGPVSEKGPEGKVVAILSRGRTHLGGTIRAVERNGDIIAHVPLLGSEQKVVVEPSQDFELKVGDRVVMQVLDWGSKETETTCRLSRYIGHISDPSCDIKAAIEEFELHDEFPAEAIEESEKFGSRVTKKDMEGREDLRHLTCVTIDPDTAKDFDDAITLEKDEKGHYHLGVHIADVSHYVIPGSAIDAEARARCNSTYFPGSCVPMLPEALSNNLCSLKPNVVRLTVSVFVHFDTFGEMVDYRIAKTFIKSEKRFSYREAKEVLDGKKKSQFLPNLQLMVELCALLKKKRYQRGSIEFAIPELAVIVDDKGTPKGTDFIAYDVTHQMIEEFMLKANELVAWHLANLGKNVAYRVHDEPAEENLREFSALAGAFGFKISDKPSSKELQELFDEALETSFGQYLATCYIRRMKMAIYSPENIGHYGLGLTHYCHFTSPIRRYIDLVVHRILFGDSDELKHLQDVTLRCSEQERISAKAENSVVLLKKLRLLKTMQDKDPYREYEAVITRVRNFGIYFEVLDLMLEGFLHVSDLDNDYFLYQEDAMRLRGNRTGVSYTAGDRVIVSLREVDFIELESLWHLVPSKPAQKKHFVQMREKKTDKEKDKKKTTSAKPKSAANKAEKEKKRRSKKSSK